MVKLVYTVALVLALDGTTKLAHATNESSYNWGYTGAYGIYHCAAHEKEVSANNPEAACDDGQNYYIPCGLADKGVTNVTACNDGYRDGFAH